MSPGEAIDDKSRTDLALEGLVHDLNNVLETIAEAADLLSEDGRWAAVAAAIHRSVDRGQRIIGGFVETTRGTAELDAVVRAAVGFTKDFLAAVRSPAIAFDVDIESGVRLKGASYAWERVLANLLINAAQAMKNGGTCRLSGKKDEEFVEIVVSDEGPGIPQTILPDIFKPHFSTKSTRRRFSGLGLHIVESVVRENGGTVSAANRAESPGAEFRIRAPGA